MSIFCQSTERLHVRRPRASRKEQPFSLSFVSWITQFVHESFHGFQKGQVHSKKHKLSRKYFWRRSSPVSPPAAVKLCYDVTAEKVQHKTLPHKLHKCKSGIPFLAQKNLKSWVMHFLKFNRQLKLRFFPQLGRSPTRSNAKDCFSGYARFHGNSIIFWIKIGWIQSERVLRFNHLRKTLARFCMQWRLFATTSYEIRYGRPFSANRVCKSSIQTVFIDEFRMLGCRWQRP